MNPNLHDIRAAAHGNWRNIHAALGIPDHLLNPRKHQPCPHCGGKNRFRYTDFRGNGGFICNQCTPQGGSGFDLLMLVFGWNFGESVKAVAQFLGLANDTIRPHPPRQPLPKTPEPPKKDKQTELLNHFQAARAICPDGAVYRYLMQRGLPMNELAPFAHIRETNADYWAQGVDGKPFKLGHFPCMVAAIHNPQGELQGLHYTYLQYDEDSNTWQKFNQKHPQTGKSLPTKKMQNRFSGSLHGAAVHMMQADDLGRLLIAEGIETSLATHALFRLLAIAALSANGMRCFEIPNDVKALYICTDHDHNRTGFAAAHDLAVRAIKQGIQAHLWQPERAGYDALDEYLLRNQEIKS